ncbi:MAG: hypothetical protein HQ492_02785 [Woeseiaceae bacterium]|nr:hypothetical protein [Woeseiaceae bacterium]
MKAFSSFGTSVLIGAQVTLNEWRWQRLLAATARPQAVSQHNFPVVGRYLISTDNGLYRVTADAVERLCDIPAFGLALAKDRIYLATWHGDWSIVLSGDRDAVLSGGDCDWRELYRVKVMNDAGRIHQIGVLDDALWLCNTALNTYTKIDRNSGAWMANIGPFKCAFGHPILVDHNHVNGVLPQPNYLIFTAFKINRESVFGIAGRGLVRLFSYPNMGAHDCVMAGEDFYFSDSYRFWDEAEGGIVVKNGVAIDKPYFDRNKAFFVRGIAGHGNEILIGNSCIGDRRERFKGRGELILVEEEMVTHSISTPCAQIYDILREDGAHFDRPPSAMDFDAASDILEKSLGQCVQEFPLIDVLSGERQKKFAKSDIGQVDEYF